MTAFKGTRQLTHPDYQVIEARPTVDVKAYAEELIPGGMDDDGPEASDL